MASERTVCRAEKVPLSTEAEPRLLRNVKGRSPNHNQAGSPCGQLAERKYHQRHGFLRVLARDLTSRLRTACPQITMSAAVRAQRRAHHTIAYAYHALAILQPQSFCSLSMACRYPANLWRKLSFSCARAKSSRGCTQNAEMSLVPCTLDGT